jgi:2-amino-4-hydroxy-6-hydroxymethyldihydropteridine diphosphokinase
LRRRPYEYLVSLGSNIDPEKSVPAAMRLLETRFEGLRSSPLYDVEAVGQAEDAPRFRNGALRLSTDLLPDALRVVLRRVEEACGRRRSADRFAPRTMDLDLVFAAPGVPDAGTLPHRELVEQAYVLWPAALVWPEARHPQLGKTLAELAVERFPGWISAHSIHP